MIKPDFFIVGAPKCGTTALFDYLCQHPEVFMCSVKEPQFFAEDTLDRFRKVQTWDGYLACFRDSGDAKRVGEASVAYLGSPAAPGRIKAFNPAARIFIMLRNPVDMMYSLHSQRIFDRRERIADFEDALKADEDRERGSSAAWVRPPGLSYRETARYEPQVRRYLNVFGRENVKIIIFDDLKHETAAVYRAALQFLDVRTDFRPEFRLVNANHRARSQWVQEFLKNPPPALRKVTHAVTTRGLRRFVGNCVLRLNVAYEPRPAMSPDLRARLQKNLAPEIEQLSGLLGRDLTYWCKDE
jgi:hypothetical protein